MYSLIKDLSDIDDDELKNLPILQEEQEQMDKSLMKSLVENLQIKSKKRIKAPDSLRSPLAPWRNADDDWKNIITEETKPEAKISRRHTMNLTDLNRITSSISAFNIFSRSDNSNDNHSYSLKHSKVSDSLSKPVYFKSGPGCCDFGYVSSQDLIKVRL